MSSENLGPENTPENKEAMRELQESLKNNPILRKLLSTLIKVPFYAAFILNPYIKKSDIRGLREGSFIGNPLWYIELEDQIEFSTARAGLWSTYDFKYNHLLPRGKGNRGNLLKDVRLMTFPIPETDSMGVDEKTPDTLFDMFDLYHVSAMTRFSIDETLRAGLIIETNYYEGLKKVGLLDRYGKAIDALDIREKKVYQVTPKGNTLIIPFSSGGDKSKPLTDGRQEGYRGGLIPQLV